MSEPTPETIIGATVDEVVINDGIIDKIVLIDSKGRYFDVWAECEEDKDHDCRLVWL